MEYKTLLKIFEDLSIEYKLYRKVDDVVALASTGEPHEGLREKSFFLKKGKGVDEFNTLGYDIDIFHSIIWLSDHELDSRYRRDGVTYRDMETKISYIFTNNQAKLKMEKK